MVKEKTFAMACPKLVNSYRLGVFLNAFEKEGLTIIGLKYMSVNSNFAKIHISRPGRIPEKTLNPKDDLEFWFNHLSKSPILILLLEGEDAIKKARQVTSSEWLIEWGNFNIKIGGDCYSSDSVKSASEDIELWFSDDNDKWSEEYCLSKDLIYIFRDKLCGDEERAPFCYDHLGYKCYEDLYYQDNLMFILIRPVAVRERLVGRILSTFEINAGRMRGLKLVNMNDLPESIAAWSTDSSSSSGTVVDDDGSCFGVAMVFERVKTKYITLTEKVGNHCFFHPKKLALDIDRNLIYMSKPGPDAWELIKLCFPFGFVLRPEINCVAILEASLKGL